MSKFLHDNAGFETIWIWQYPDFVFENTPEKIKPYGWISIGAWFSYNTYM